MSTELIFKHASAPTPEAIFDLCYRVWPEALWKDHAQHGRYEDVVYNPASRRFMVYESVSAVMGDSPDDPDKCQANVLGFYLVDDNTTSVLAKKYPTEGNQGIVNVLIGHLGWTLTPPDRL